MSALPPITELVPHQPPMLVLDRLLDWTPGRARAELTLRDGNPFATAGGVEAVGCLEFMAQAIAACLGMEAFCGGTGVRLGMVVACRSMTLHRDLLPFGATLVVEVERQHGTDALSSFTGRVHDGDGTPIAEANLTLVHGAGPA